MTVIVDVLIGVLAWMAIAVIALGLCRAAAQGDVFEDAYAARRRNRRHGPRRRTAAPPRVARVAARAALAGHAVVRHGADPADA
jgi:hypothetical protein